MDMYRHIPSRLGSLAGGMLLALTIHAQRDGSLARDFDKLSAKERARVAKEEQDGAAKDVAYQAVMGDAEKLFQQQRYEASMEKFKEARTMRPYNVYPKVKIQDLEALIARRDAMAAVDTVDATEPIATSVPTPANTESPVETMPLPASAPAKLVISATEAPVRTAHPSQAGAVPRTSGPASAKPMERPIIAERTTLMERRVEPKPAPVLEEGERIYKEGRSVVLERRLAVEGRIVVFRKVSHPWGEIHYFREGIAISSREFEEAR
ncbi:MAG: hypothetical protein JNM62_03425 [Flavobacteriales bacterium]|nr:hypothetical protein [Flavobacteriales bacterium]